MRSSAPVGPINFASPGNGTASHLATAVFMDLTQTQRTHVPDEPQTRKKLVDLGTWPMVVTGAELQTLIDQETIQWRDVARANITA